MGAMLDSSTIGNLLRGRRILVTGAARGLGYEFAVALCQAGAQVAMADILASKSTWATRHRSSGARRAPSNCWAGWTDW